MAYPWGPGVLPTPQAFPHPVAPPPGHGCVALSVNRGPYIISATATSRLKIDTRTVRIGGEGTWYIPVPAGAHDIRFTDWLGIPIMTTQTMVHPGYTHPLSFRFGAWRNRVYDGQGTDVTKFGMWSNYAIGLTALAVGLICGGFAVIATLAG